MIGLLALLSCERSDDVGPAQTVALTLFVIRHHEVCVVGRPCEGEPCVRLSDELAFAEGATAVPPGDPSVGSAELATCVDLTVTDADLDEIEAEAAVMEDDVFAWTGGALAVAIEVVPVERASLSLTPLWGGWWMAPWDVSPALSDLVDPLTDGTLVTTGLYDPDQGLRVESPLCGGTLGGDWGLSGAGYSWVPRIDGLWYECAEHGVYTHEWLHQVEWNLWTLTPGREEALWSGEGHDYPECGAEIDPLSYFPSTHDCLVDPDAPDCGAEDCSGNDPVNAHVIEAHWDPSVMMATNHCVNGVQDHGETSVDVGGNCAAPPPPAPQLVPRGRRLRPRSAAPGPSPPSR